MRIDLNHAAASQLASELNSQQVNAQQPAASSSAGSEDRTTLSSTDQSVSTLVSTAMSTPEVRQDKVDALKEAVSSGQYKLDPHAIAGSMLDEHA